MGDIKRSMPWQGSLSKLGRTVTGVMFWQGIKCLLRRRPVCHSTRLMYRYRWLYNACLWRFCMLMPWFLLFSDPHLLHIANDCSKSKFTLTPKHLKVLDNYLFYFSYVLLFSTIHLNCVLLHCCYFLCTFRSCLCKCPDYLPLVVFLEFTALNIVVQVRNLFPFLLFSFTLLDGVPLLYTGMSEFRYLNSGWNNYIQSLPQAMPWAPTDLLPRICP